MKNGRSVLPFSKEKTAVVIGPIADFAGYCGGRSASVLPCYAVTLLAGIRKHAQNGKYQQGAVGWKNLPLSRC